MPADWQPLPEDRDQSPDDFPSGDDSADAQEPPKHMPPSPARHGLPTPTSPGPQATFTLTSPRPRPQAHAHKPTPTSPTTSCNLDIFQLQAPSSHATTRSI
ncbi:hypothetical protein PTT_14904 [Pyrenophora teres f. teres 0-1]|uniref:Uncharacterized protein n=1 Tax=Pyrenophora teres f. teres (strain 0-1) TaxID=861557 RepID=E3RZ52_PYRTT|nr:hypothetical protein PTT_14904 [Pyrenophora teres f. teres 0-1]